MRDTEFITGELRLKWPFVFEPNPQSGKYSITCMLPKSNTAVKSKMDAAINSAKQFGAVKHWRGTVPPNIPDPIWDGDGKNSRGEDFSAECRGCWVFSAKRLAKFGPPKIVGGDLQPIEALRASEIYSGMYGVVYIEAYPYDTNGNRGIGFGLIAIQKTRDGAVLTSREPAPLAEVFSKVQTDADGFMLAPKVDPFSGQPM